MQPKRYKVARGGRGGAKSHFFADLLLSKCLGQRIRAVCIREVQNSIKDSVKQLIEDKIEARGVGHVFEVLESEIRGPHGSLIIFKGMQSYNAENIKSLEDFDIAWWEEAQTASARSLRLLRPTIRKEGSEIWFSYNQRYDTDPVDVEFYQRQRDDTICITVTWRDNPWFPDVLRKEMEADYAADPVMAAHVWGTEYETITEGAYFARYVSAAEAEGRIGAFPYRKHLPVTTSWDIGVDDYTAIWFWQTDTTHATVIDYYETQNLGAEQIIAEALPEYHEDIRAGAERLIELGRKEPWRYGEHLFPHDVRVREWGAGARTRVETLMGLGLRNIRKVANNGPEERIAAARRLFPLVRFNDTPAVRMGIKRLQRYSRRFNEAMGIWGGPLHDDNSHGADAFGEYAVNCPLIAAPVEKKRKPVAFDPRVRIGPPEPRKSTRIRL